MSSDVSTSFKRLQAEKTAADRIFRELTPLESIQEADALRDFLQNVNFKTEVRISESFYFVYNLTWFQMAQDEIKRLTGKLTRTSIPHSARTWSKSLTPQQVKKSA